MNKKNSNGPKRALHKYAFDTTNKPSDSKNQLVELEKSQNYKPKFLVEEDKRQDAEHEKVVGLVIAEKHTVKEAKTVANEEEKEEDKENK